MDDLGHMNPKKFGTSGWEVAATKEVELPREQVEAALAREFNLPLPGGRTYGRDEDILRVYGSLP